MPVPSPLCVCRSGQTEVFHRLSIHERLNTGQWYVVYCGIKVRYLSASDVMHLKTAVDRTAKHRGSKVANFSVAFVQQVPNTDVSNKCVDRGGVNLNSVASQITFQTQCLKHGLIRIAFEFRRPRKFYNSNQHRVFDYLAKFGRIQ